MLIHSLTHRASLISAFRESRDRMTPRPVSSSAVRRLILMVFAALGPAVPWAAPAPAATASAAALDTQHRPWDSIPRLRYRKAGRVPAEGRPSAVTRQSRIHFRLGGSVGSPGPSQADIPQALYAMTSLDRRRQTACQILGVDSEVIYQYLADISLKGGS